MITQRLYSTIHLTARDRRVVHAALACGRLDSGALSTGKGRWAVRLKWITPGRVLLYSDADGRGQRVYVGQPPTEAENAADWAADAPIRAADEELTKLIVQRLMAQEDASKQKNFVHVLI